MKIFKTILCIIFSIEVILAITMFLVNPDVMYVVIGIIFAFLAFWSFKSSRKHKKKGHQNNVVKEHNSLGIFSGKGLKDELKQKTEQLEQLKSKAEAMEKLLSPEMKDILKLQDIFAQCEDKINHADADLSELRDQIENNRLELKKQNHQILVNEETIELETFALYRPTYSFTHSDEYKEKLTLIRSRQKEMIKNGTAAFGSQTWTVNNSASKGRKLVKDMQKLCLRSFNNECDAAVEKVRFNNYEKCEQRIMKSADAIEKLGQMMGVSITPGYISLKKQELQLALEYQIKKQAEKEELKELRAQQREEARVAKEIEEQRKKALKEKLHYENALKQLKDQITACHSEDEKNALESKLETLSSHLSDIEKNMIELDYREANQRAGYVYVISNIGAFGENVYKIGMTRRLEPTERVDELGDASVPYNFDIHAMIFSDDAPALEAALHRAFEDRKLNMVNTRREFFKVTLDEIKAVVKEHHDKTVEFIDVPSAEQYRESLRIRESMRK